MAGVVTPYKQINHHDPDNGVWGDCYRTAVGCLLDLPPSTLPHVLDRGEWAPEVMREWLSERGLYLVEFPLEMASVSDVLELVNSWNPECPHWLLSGSSGNDVNHVVVCKGAEIVHDPSLNDSGILGPIAGPMYAGAVYIVSFLCVSQ